MKTTILFILIAAMTLFASCSKFLDVAPESKIPDEAIFENAENLDAYMLGLYKAWRDGHRDRIGMYMGTDEANIGGNQWRDDNAKRGLDMYQEGMNSTNGIALGIWRNRHEVASRAANAITSLSQTESTNSDEFNLRLAEACFLRGVNYFELVQMFGAIPLSGMEGLGESNSSRQPLDVVYKMIEADFVKAEKYLPDPADASYQDLRRATKPLAQAMLGKLYLYAAEESGFRDYEKAAAQFEKVYNNPYYGGTGAPTYSVIFDANSESSAQHQREMVYAFQFSNVSGDQSSIQWDMGSRAVTNMTPVEATALFAGFDGIMPTEYAYEMVSEGGLWEEGDVRREESIRYDFTWNGQTPSMSGYIWGDELDPHIKKFEDPRILEQGLSTYYSGKNVPFIRFSDVVLCYAECLYHIGRQNEGITLINDIVRTRAFGGTLPGTMRWSTDMGEAEFTANLMDERMRELCFEGWRKLDLMRTGLLKNYVEKRNRWVSGMYKQERINPAVSIENFRLLWPIPLDELRQNPNLTDADQNPGY
ncbi:MULTISPECIES: RagB/SusD family nutrient uptake outer membrane protein [Sphingobacterium]|uniref:RagB/SusD family nutrient uptake outer membrane protein n=1 Tax=Sphingobacterium populi TaxID=1812824 RepID=A0ABW5UH79_9SPHI|nr:RagB/SusD family nutrient uptake outer membrane protein [Sphingobacterium sp. CFCC 11742]